MTAMEPVRREPPFSRRLLDPRAVDVISRLQQAGFETYFVGGCVRDLLLEQRPKDFDIATSAHPEQVRDLFRRSRVIGRRFQLVHVYSGRGVYEVSTFRRDPEEAQDTVQIIRRDNTFGSAREDALRRDFTVNALFLDPVAGALVDWVGGLEDLGQRRLRSIGDPERRFREDPVRILRLVKFLRRLRLEPGPAEVAAAYRYAPHLVHAAPPRVAEELFRLLATGDAEGVLEDLLALRALSLVVPDLGPWLTARAERVPRLRARLAGLDNLFRDGSEPSYALRLAFLYGARLEEELGQGPRARYSSDPLHLASLLLRPLQQRARLPRLVVLRAAEILAIQQRLNGGPEARRRQGFDPAALIERESFPEALEYLRCRLEATGDELSTYDQWHELALSLEPRRR
ncbi:MAG: polynucleotide adenylyltransferase PcnB [Planctomycetota bacterium]|nr:MAG: polynucleotide adenylyltransferase PcnB [Planctomycetota bacterium]